MTWWTKTSRWVGLDFNSSILLKWLHWSSTIWDKKWWIKINNNKKSFFFFMFLKNVSYTHKIYIYLIQNTKTAILWNIITMYKKLFILLECILKCNSLLWSQLNFHQPLLQSSVSHDPSEVILIRWFDAQATFLLSMLNRCAAIFLRKSR